MIASPAVRKHMAYAAWFADEHRAYGWDFPPAPERDEHRQCVVGHLLDAVVGHVRDPDPPLRCRSDVDDVVADPGPVVGGVRLRAVGRHLALLRGEQVGAQQVVGGESEWFGIPAIEYGRELDADLIVVGSASHGPLGRADVQLQRRQDVGQRARGRVRRRPGRSDRHAASGRRPAPPPRSRRSIVRTAKCA